MPGKNKPLQINSQLFLNQQTPRIISEADRNRLVYLRFEPLRSFLTLAAWRYKPVSSFLTLLSRHPVITSLGLTPKLCKRVAIVDLEPINHGR